MHSIDEPRKKLKFNGKAGVNFGDGDEINMIGLNGEGTTNQIKAQKNKKKPQPYIDTNYLDSSI